MNKDEMKNRISMALKDPMLQQGFEIICKENAELKERCNILDKSLVTSTKNNIERQKIIDELKEEKAELKLKLEALDGQTPWKDIKDKSEVIGKLTKAKELIKRLMHELVVSNRPYDEVELLVKDVEQFLNSEVEK